LGFLEKVGTRKAQSGSQIILYQLTTRANVAILLNHINPDFFVAKADEDSLILEVTTLAIFYEKNKNAF
jgi:hypothetical protein